MKHDPKDWDEESVDLYVDDECSEEERRAVEERAEKDERTRDAILWARRLREIMRAAVETAPVELDARVRRAIDSSPVWDERRREREREATNVPRVAARATNGRKFRPAFVGSVAATVLVALCAAAFWNLPRERSRNAEPGAIADTSLPKEKSETSAAESDPWMLVPSPDGNAPDAEAKENSQKAFWAISRVEKARLTDAKRALQRRCVELNVSFVKSNDDLQYRLKDVERAQWRKIAETLEGSETSEALASWDEASQETRTIRVSFEANDEAAVEDDSNESNDAL